MLTLEEVFPPFALRISCASLELRVLRDEDLPELVELVRGGIQTPARRCPCSLDLGGRCPSRSGVSGGRCSEQKNPGRDRDFAQ